MFGVSSELVSVMEFGYKLRRASRTESTRFSSFSSYAGAFQ